MAKPEPIPAARLDPPDSSFLASIGADDLVYFLCNIGDGDAQVLLVPDAGQGASGSHRAVIVDAGAKNKLPALIDALIGANLLKREPGAIALVVATHPHLDHIAGIAQLLSQYRGGVAEFWDPGYFQPSPPYFEMMAAIENDPNLLYAQPASGLRRWIGNVAVTVLAPAIGLRNRFDTYGVDINDSSLALLIEFPAARVVQRDKERRYVKQPRTQALVLGADAQTLSWSYVETEYPYLRPSESATAKALQMATGRDLLKAQVLKVSHHASKHGVNLELVERIVGKVPDPKSQVEQITIALIYKFMDDMDAESEEFGGKRKFFAGDFARYGWAKLMRSGLGGHEILNLYAEAIAKMPENPGIPPLFRDIFKNAFLPYRDPETLRAFLKIIDEFEYDHSERLGDAFEYLLSVLGSQGDAGQFRTPRHIIDFIVTVVDPKKNETVIDPACGTAGFLISSYKHILKANVDAEGNSTLTPDERGRLAANFKGYDISPDMVRLSLVNLYLHGFTDPHIFEYDTLTSQDRWNEYADVILANPPFMSPKGGIKPHNRFSVQSKRSEVLFVDYMAEHLTPSGRAGIIVPEGIIFQSGAAFQQLREVLINDFLIGVISLPSGVFMPYTGVKTSVLVLDRAVAKHNPNILFSDVKQIGVSLGIKRTPTEHNDLPYVLRDYRAYYDGRELSRHSWLTPRDEILANECNLTGLRYRPVAANGGKRVVKIADVCRMTKGTSSSTTTPPGPYPLVLTAAKPKTSSEYQFDGPAVCVPLISSTGHGKATLNRIHYASGRFALANLLVALQPSDNSELDARFLYYALDERKIDIAALMRGAANVGMKPEDLAQFEIPLPPLEVQKEIVAEIEGYQKVIDVARAVSDNYRPHIPIHPDWPMVELGKVARLINGRAYKQEELLAEGPTPVLRVGNFFSNRGWYYSDLELEEDKYCNEGDLLYAWSASFGPRIWEGPRAIYHYHIWKIETSGEIDKKFLFHLLEADSEKIKSEGNGIAMMHATKGGMEQRKFPLPPIATQQAIVAEIEAEQALVNANRELTGRFEKKIQVILARVWGEAESSLAES